MSGTAIDILDGLSSSTAIKGPCACATTVNIALHGEQTIDGILTAESRVLVKSQTAPTENGVYRSSSGDWERTADFSRNDDVVDGTVVLVAGGAVNSGLWAINFAGSMNFDTTAISFVNDLVAGGVSDGDKGDIVVSGDGAVWTIDDGDKGDVVIAAGVWTFDSAVVTAAARTVLDDTTIPLMRATLGALGGSTGATDNRLLRADGTGGATAQSSAVTLDDSGNLTGIVGLTASGQVVVGLGSGGALNGQIILNPSDAFPGFIFLANAVAKALLVADVSSGTIYYDAPGGFVIRDTVNGGGFQIIVKGAHITFPVVAEASAGAGDLDDYKEATFTARIDGTTLAGAGTYSVQVGKITKVGERVFGEAEITWSAHTGTGNMKIAGLPFTNGARKSPVSLSFSNLTFAAALHGYVEASGTTIALFTAATTAAEAALPIDTAATLRVSFSYSVN